MARNWIVVGDTTSGGGRVVSGSPTDNIDGKAWAFVGCPVVCAKHGLTSITTGDATMLICGQAAARHGDCCACGCLLISTQQMRAFVDPGSAAPTTVKGSASAKSSHPASGSRPAPQAPHAGGPNAVNPPACWVKDHDKLVSVDADGRYSETFDKGGKKHNYYTPRKFKVLVPLHTAGSITVEVRFKAVALPGVTAAEVVSAKSRLESGVKTYWNNAFSLEIEDQPCGTKILAVEYKVIWVASGENYTMNVHASYPREGVTGNILDVSKTTTDWTYAHEFGHCVGDPDEYSYTPDTETVQYYKPDGTLDANAIVALPFKPAGDPDATIMSSFGNTTVLPRHAWSVGREVQELLTKEIGRPVVCKVF